jgi:hypothetical protein
VDVNDPSNWAEITGSLDAPTVGASPPFQWQGGVAGPLNPNPTDTYDFHAGPIASDQYFNFTGLQYIGPALVGTLSLSWEALGYGQGQLIVNNQASQLAVKTVPIPNSYPYQDQDNGILGVPVNAADTVLRVAFIRAGEPGDYGYDYPGIIGLTFSFVPGSGIGPVTGGDGPNAAGFGRHIWRPRDNAVC